MSDVRCVSIEQYEQLKEAADKNCELYYNQERKIKQLQAKLDKANVAICMFCQAELPRYMDDKEKQAEILVNHIYECPNHPIVKLQAENETLKERIDTMLEAGTDLCFAIDNLDFVKWCSGNKESAKNEVVLEAKAVFLKEQALQELKGGAE